MTKLHIADNLSLPIEGVTQTFAVLGIRGSGKTNTATVIAEEMLKRDQQIVVLDPTDAWYGIRSSRDGKQEGFKVFVIGGEHGDIPLDGANGIVMAEFVVETGASVVFSLRHLSIHEQRRFAQDFAERLYDLKGKSENRTPLHIFVDEADEFIPQRIPPGFERMFGAYDRLVRRGRSSGIGLTMISQRPQVLNKDTLSQCEILVCHRLLHKLDRKAVKEGWVEGHDIEDKVGEFMESLASLEKGDAWFWSPSWLDIFKKVHVRWRDSFDSSFTPKAGEKPKVATKLAEVDLDVLKKRLAATIAKAKSDDPKELKKRIKELESQVSKGAGLTPSSSSSKSDVKKQITTIKALKAGIEAAMKVIATISAKGFEKVGLSAEQISAVMEKASAEIVRLAESSISRRTSEFEKLRQEAERVLIRLQQLANNEEIAVNLDVTHNEPFTIKQTTTRPRLAKNTATLSGGHLPPGEKSVLVAAGQFGSVERDQLSVLTGYKRSSRDAYIARLLQRGYISVTGKTVEPTQEGVDALGSDYEPLPTGDDLQEYWKARLPEGERAILEILLVHQGKPVNRDILDEKTGYKRSSRDAYLARLTARRLVETVGRGEVQASANLFD